MQSRLRAGALTALSPDAPLFPGLSSWFRCRLVSWLDKGRVGRRALPLTICLGLLAGQLPAQQGKPAPQEKATQTESPSRPQKPSEANPSAQLPSEKTVLVVTGHYEGAPLEESQRAITVVDLPALRQTAASIADALRLDSSVDLRERAPGAIQSGASIRGGSFGQTLVLWNGFRLNDVQTANFHMDVPVPLYALQQVEVLKGGGSALYGSDAVAGVIHFRTTPQETPPAERLQVNLRTGFGSFGTQQQHANVHYSRGRVQQQLSAARDFSTGFLPNRDFRNLSLASQTNIGRRTELLLAHNDRPFGAQNFYGNFNSWERTKTWFAGLRQGIDDKTEARLAYRRHTDLFVLYRDRPQVFTNRHIVEGWQANVQRRQPLPRGQALYFGGEFLHDGIVSNNLGQHSRSRTGLFTGWDAAALGRWSISAGLRTEIYRNNQLQWNPHIGAGYWLSSRWKLRANLSRSFRLPTYTDLYYRDPANVGDPNLKPESAWGYEGGADVRLAANWQAQVTVFARRESNGIDYVRANPTEIWRATNFQSLRFRGWEGSLKTTIANRHLLQFAYTGLTGAQAALAGRQSKYAFNYPRHSGLVSYQTRWKEAVLVRTRVGVVQRLARDAYAAWDLFAARPAGRLRPYAQFTNLGNARYEDFPGVPQPGRAALAGVEVVLTR